jgi:16S rRNA (cytosine967-C5)-methyltransferase
MTLQKKKARRKVSLARLDAFEILQRVDEGAYSSVLLANLDLKSEDRALCHELVLGVLRRRIFLDALIEHYASRNVSKIDSAVLQSLRLGFYQLRFLTRIPESAAVNESVNLVYRARVSSAAGFVNAVLRRAVREKDLDPTANVKNDFERIALQTSHPVWLIEKWIGDFGIEETGKLANANNEATPIAFRLTNKGDESLFQNINPIASEIAPNAWRVEKTNSFLQQLSSDGKIYFQDEASQLVAYILDAQENDSVLDVCAAPGSKTTHISTLQPKLKRLVACDVHEHRLNVIKELAAKTGVEKLGTIKLDATEDLPFADEEFDRVLVDAPCSGTGTLRRNPEIRYRITADDIAKLAEKQKRILAKAARVVKVGGRLVYSTCSVEKEENEFVVKDFLMKNNAFKIVPAGFDARLLCENGTIRTFPHKHGTDGFFIAVFERKA